MSFKIKNWSRHQHFKDRRPPWIKLYRDILDDPEWHSLDSEAAKLLVMLWLLASENEGELPNIKTISFRLRVSEKQVSAQLSKLSHWMEQDDITMISPRHQDVPVAELNNSVADIETPRRDRGETETEEEVEKDHTSPVGSDFDRFWSAYPKKVGKANALKEWKKANPNIESVLEALANQKAWRANPPEGEFVPAWKDPERWIKAGCWNDEVAVVEEEQDEWAAFPKI
jgi:hypothetical protein